MSDKLSFRFVGDIHVDRDEPESSVQYVSGITTAADVLFGNLEVPICEVGHEIQGKPGGAKVEARRSSPKNISALTAAGFSAVSVATNHSMDYGWAGVHQMQSLLDDVGIQHAGGGANIDEAHTPAIVETHGVKSALLSYTSVYMRKSFEAGENRGGVATVQVDTCYEAPPRYFEVPGLPATVRTIVAASDRSRVENDIRQARQDADFVVVSWHWGISGGYGKVLPYEVELAHMAIDLGADVVVGTHPHMLHPIEIYRGKAIFYSLGNFSFSDPEHFERESAILEVIAGKDREISSLRVYPTWIDDEANPAPLDLEDERTRGVLERLSYRSNVSFEPSTSGKYFEVHALSNEPDLLRRGGDQSGPSWQHDPVWPWRE